MIINPANSATYLITRLEVSSDSRCPTVSSQCESRRTFMRWFTMIGMTGVLTMSLNAADNKAFTFDKTDAGKTQKGWKVDKTGTGNGSVWKVVEDATAPSKKGYAVAQTAEGPGPLFNLCIAEDSTFKDGEISVAFKAIKGNKDQGGG